MLAAVLFGIAGLVLASALSAAWGVGTSKHSLSHTQWMVVLIVTGGLGPLSLLLFWAWWRLSGRYDKATGSGRRPKATSFFEPHDGPDLDRPSDLFVDGGFAYQVLVTSALSPMLFLRDSRGLTPAARLFQLVAQLIVIVVTTPFDRRSKVVVSRRLVAAGHMWGIVKIEFFEDAGTADARATEILTNWDLVEYAALKTLTRTELREPRKTKA